MAEIYRLYAEEGFLEHVAFIICCSKPEILDPEAVQLAASLTNSSNNPIQQAKF
jgi:hypothetical protein